MDRMIPYSGTPGTRLVDVLLAHLRDREVEPLPEHGGDPEETIERLLALRSGDVPWADGKLFGMVHDGGSAVRDVAERAALAFLHENALNPIAFPSVGVIQTQLVRWMVDLLHGPSGGSGFVTSGGTESILCAVIAARERARAERGLDRGTIVVPSSAHPAFHKAAFLFDLPIVVTGLDDGFAADLDDLAAAVDERTILVVGSAPQYPHGVIDPIPEIAALARSVGASCHVDACMGGHVLPFAERLGRPVPPWDFRVDGVDSISADHHKLGYAPKGVSTVLYRSADHAARQVWDLTWLGGYYATVGIQGSRSAAPMAAAWAVMQHLGLAGFDELVRGVLAQADRMRAAVEALDGIRVLGDPSAHLFAIGTDPAAVRPVAISALDAAMRSRGWIHELQTAPDSLHVTVSNTNVAAVATYPEDLAAAVAEAAVDTA